MYLFIVRGANSQLESLSPLTHFWVGVIKVVIATPITGGVGTVSKPTLRYEVTKHSYGHEGHMHINFR